MEGRIRRFAWFFLPPLSPFAVTGAASPRRSLTDLRRTARAERPARLGRGGAAAGEDCGGIRVGRKCKSGIRVSTVRDDRAVGSRGSSCRRPSHPRLPARTVAMALTRCSAFCQDRNAGAQRRRRSRSRRRYRKIGNTSWSANPCLFRRRHRPHDSRSDDARAPGGARDIPFTHL